MSDKRLPLSPVCALLLGAFTCISARAQTTPSISVTTRLVVLDVVVVDSRGNTVTGLDRSQFTVFEDKVEQRVRDFEGPKDHAMPGGSDPLVHSTADLPKIGNAPVNVIVIDEMNTAFANTARAQQAMRHFLEKQPEVLPVPTLFLAAGASRMTVLHDFTQSRADLLASMKTHITDIDFRALANQLNGGSMSAPDGFAKTLGALSQVASSLRGIRGHKNVIWIGTGFDNAYDITSASDTDAEKIQAALQLVTRRMLEARISLSTLDPAGVDAQGGDEDFADEAEMGVGATSMFTQEASFDGLAQSTGGTVVHGRNDLDRLIATEANRAGDFYTLTYVPSSSSDAAQTYRNIRVVMKDPKLHAVTRTGYFAGTATEPALTASEPKTQSREFRFDLLSAASSRLVYTGLRVSVEKVAAGFNVFVEAGGLHWTQQDDGQMAEVTVIAVAFNGKDKDLRQHAEEYKKRIDQSDQPNGRRVGFLVPLTVPPATARLRFVVRDATTGTMGSADLKP